MKLKNFPLVLPLYAANGTILLPRAQLPLMLQGIDEKAVIECALQDSHRLLGVIQANPEGGHFQKGCVGQIINFQDGVQVFITLGGLCRFKIEEILEKAHMFHQNVEAAKAAVALQVFLDIKYFNCGHGIHNEKSREFVSTVRSFLSKEKTKDEEIELN